MIDFILWIWVFAFRYIYRFRQRLKGPVLVILSPFFNPLINQFFLSFGKWMLTFRQWHPRLDHRARWPVNFRIFQIARGQTDKSIVLPDRFLKRIDTKVRLLVLCIGAMALVALIRKNRPNFPVEIHFCIQARGDANQKKMDREFQCENDNQ